MSFRAMSLFFSSPFFANLDLWCSGSHFTIVMRTLDPLRFTLGGFATMTS